MLGIIERVKKRLGLPWIKIAKTEYDVVYGSRRVTKDVNNPDQKHFYEVGNGEYDLWTTVGMEVKDTLPQGYMLFGEIIGWTPQGAPIQQGYTYKIPQGQHELYIYRVAQVNPQGKLVDLSWDQVKEFCETAGLKHVPELWRGPHFSFNAEDWLDVRYHDDLKLEDAVPLEPSTKKNPIVDEGVVVRVEGLVPYCLKAKSPVFYEYETKQLDKEVVDIESAEAA